ncbi:MAG TPA: ElyC/SanA/YdcF family protein [Anaerolineales bacterium]
MVLSMVLVLVVLVALFSVLPRLWTALYAWPRLHDISDAPPQQVAIVFGAGLRWDGSPSPVLRDRVDTAAQLYFSGKVEKLLMSGDNRWEDYNEPAAMQAYALSLGIPAEDIVLDYAGRRTYDTCYRARHIFKVESAALVTQGFHLPRALYLCNTMGLTSIGVSADQRNYRQRATLFWNLRETAATLVALWEVHVSRPVPVLGEPEPIFSQEAQ